MIGFLCGPAAGGLLSDRGGLRDGVIVLQYRDPVFVIFVGTFAFDITEICESIECHSELLFTLLTFPDPFGLRRGRKRPWISGTLQTEYVRKTAYCRLSFRG